ncbi:MAG: recombinase family protein, partial [Nostocaceae cyanobacterium]|nr:recombinase family protein [Nostocaceae cyanobacterium]
MISHCLWIVGPSRSGKTTHLVDEFARWVKKEQQRQKLSYTRKLPQSSGDNIAKKLRLEQGEIGVLALAANDDNRRELADKIVAATGGKYPVRCKTPLGFFQDEVILFWPLLIQLLQIKAQFPVRLRPETEQELATKLWRPQLNEEILRGAGVNEYRFVRRVLDLLVLAAYSGTSCEDIAHVLETGLQEQQQPQLMASLLLQWRSWCLERGFLTYGIITELYSQQLLPNANYQQHLMQRYQAVLADDVDEYPAVGRHLFELLLERGAKGTFTYNPVGGVRVGLGADPNYLEGLAARCRLEVLTPQPGQSLADTLATPILSLVTQSAGLVTLPSSVQLIQTTSRAKLLRETAEEIIKVIKQGQIKPEEVAVIAPGLDAIARYTLVEILSKQNIPVESLNDQRPLISSPIIRALLTTLALVYPGLGRLVDRDAVAEMLVVLSRKKEQSENSSADGWGNPGWGNPGWGNPTPTELNADIDPVRAGLLADYCFQPHPERPNLLPVKSFPRWDRLGYAASTAYEQILQWLQQQRQQLEQRLIPSPISLLDRTIVQFLWNGSNLPYDQLAALRELLETAQHYWEIDTRLNQVTCRGGETPPLENRETLPLQEGGMNSTIAEFIKLLRYGTITANPYPVRPIGTRAKAVTLATIFQYRSSRRTHRIHFWLDVSSPLWLSGGAATLFGAPLFLQDRFGQFWTAEEAKEADEQRLHRILVDLLARVQQRVYLCHSDLAVNGQEQLG